MMQIKRGIISLVLGGVLAAMVWPLNPVSAEEGIGVYPPVIEITDALREGVYFHDLGVLNNEARPLTLSLAREGNIAQWISLHSLDDRETPLEQVVAPPGEQTRLLLKLAVPPDVPDGNYSGNITLSAPGVNEEIGGSSSVGLGVRVELHATVVGTHTLKGRVLDITADDAELGKPLRVTTRLANEGNVRFEPRVDLKVSDSTGFQVGSVSFVHGAVFPHDVTEVISAWDTTGQPLGDYVVNVDVFAGELRLGGREEMQFKLVEPGSLNDSDRDIDPLLMLAGGGLAAFLASGTMLARRLRGNGRSSG